MEEKQKLPSVARQTERGRVEETFTSLSALKLQDHVGSVSLRANPGVRPAPRPCPSPCAPQPADQDSLCTFPPADLNKDKCMLAWSLSCVQLFVTPWTIAHQALLSIGFSRQETGVGCLGSCGGCQGSLFESSFPATVGKGLEGEQRVHSQR